MVYFSFNSLQTGKQFRTGISKKETKQICVSIPFKRESSSEQKRIRKRERLAQYEFQFPSNGKVVPNCSAVHPRSFRQYVSIPFKRESSSEQVEQILKRWTTLWFQFPSNGKVVPNISSLPELDRSLSFNSLQTGKQFRTHQKTYQ